MTTPSDPRYPDGDAEWWESNRLRCPRCRSSDCGTIGASNSPADSNDWNRTDLNLADLARCETCGWESKRALSAAEDERLFEEYFLVKQPRQQYVEDILRMRRERLAHAAELREQIKRLES